MGKKRRECTYKRFMNAAEAIGFARRTRDWKHLRAYKCRYCSGWHVARNKPSRLAYLFDLIEQQRGPNK